MYTFTDKSVGAWERNIEYNSVKPEEQNETSEFYSVGESENSDISFVHDTSISNKQNLTCYEISSTRTCK